MKGYESPDMEIIEIIGQVDTLHVSGEPSTDWNDMINSTGIY